MILASFFDVNNNGLDIADVVTICSAVGAFFLGGRWVVGRIVESIREIVCDEVARATYPIQPTSNGGLSLPDVARKTSRNEAILIKLAAHNNVDISDIP